MAELDPAVVSALALIEPGRREQDSRTKGFDKAYDIYRPKGDRPKNREPWQSNLRVPYAMANINTGLVNIVSGAPRIKVRPRRGADEAGAKAMQSVLDYFVGEDHLVEKQPQFVQQGLICGVTVAKNHWLYRHTDRPAKTFTRHPLTGEMQVGVERMKVVTRDGPTFEPWNAYHAFWEPGARDVDDAAYVVLQTYLSKDQLLRQKVNSDTGEGIYSNVEALLATGSAPKPRSTAQDGQNGVNTLDRYKGKFLIEEIWTDDMLLVVGNRQVLLRAQENPYWHGRKPVVIAQTIPDLFEMVGISETELVDHLQQGMHTLQNMTIDNVHMTTMRGITYREGGVTDPNSLVLKPRFKWGVSDHDDIRPFAVEPVSSDVFTERQRMQADMQQVSGITPYVSGTDNVGVDQNTATGVTALQEVASRLLRFKAGQIHYKGYQRSFEMWGDMVQQFLDRDVEAKIVHPKTGEEMWAAIAPSDVAGHYHYVLEGSEESLSRQQERGEATALLNAFAPLASLGIVNFKPILEKVAAAFNIPNPETLLAPAPPPQAQAAPYPPGQQSPPQQLLGGQTLDPRIQAAIQNH